MIYENIIWQRDESFFFTTMNRFLFTAMNRGATGDGG
jgi:hypothetical protein